MCIRDRDLGAREVWQTKLALVISECSKVVLSDSLEQCATDEQRKNGLDIADFLLMTETPVSYTHLDVYKRQVT